MPAPHSGRKRERATPQAENVFLKTMQACARENAVWLHLGSLVLKDDTTDQLWNRSFLIDQDGHIVASYDKIHLFDYGPPDGEAYQESALYQAGTKPVLAQTPWGGLGLSICYDLRFPTLYQHYRQAGASFLAIPAAFTVTTGKAHWELLLRARAVETQCFVFAAAQVGEHGDGRTSWGHSMIVSPWGDLCLALDGQSETSGVIPIDIEQLSTVRQSMPRRKVWGFS